MNKYFLYLLTVLPILLSPKAKGQIRTQGANYLEVSAGVPILWDNNVFNLKAGDLMPLVLQEVIIIGSILLIERNLSKVFQSQAIMKTSSLNILMKIHS
jgi:hypothetical protein